MGLTKKYLKKRPVCKTTFTLEAENFKPFQSAFLVGDFNEWDEKATPMKKQKDGSFSVTLDLECGHSYAFRYLLDNGFWENDWDADNYLPSPFHDAENSLVVV